jgi:hypothetical protein
MVKQFILLIQLIGVFFYQLVLTGDVTVSQTIPETIQANTEAIVEIKVNKSDLTGFAKVQQDVPEGFYIESIETKGATFSFKDNRIKFIWMALPSEEEFVISYKIKPNEGVSGDFSLGGKFSFIADSERKNIVIPESKFKVNEEILAEVPKEEPEEEPVTEEPVEEEPVIEEPKEEDPIVAEEPKEEDPVVVEEPKEEEPPITEEPAKTLINVSVTRNIEDQGEGKYLITLNVKKDGVEGFAKITESIPLGFTAIETAENGSVFSFKEQTMKMLWMAIPKGETLEVSYLLQANEGAENGVYDLKGEFAYLEDDITQKYSIETSSLELKREEPVIAEVPEEEPVTEVPVEEEPVIEEPVVVDEPKNEEPANDNSSNTNNITNVPSPETNVTFKVQVGAGHKAVAANYFAVKFNLQDNVSTESHEGWIKYVVGSYGVYKEARDKRNVVRNNVKRAFVTAYNSGKRITVQEALMISNQKWFK